MIQQDLRCQSQALYSGPHLRNHFDWTLPNCSLMETTKAIKILLNQSQSGSECQALPKCDRVKYVPSSIQKYLKTNNETLNYTRVYIKYQELEVENHLIYISYEFVNLLGELGGILGLTLGFSGASLLAFAQKNVCVKCSH